jgi:hypothetical protein
VAMRTENFRFAKVRHQKAEKTLRKTLILY